MKREKLFLKFCFSLSLLAFFFVVFKNISYPLFWNDEAETAVFAQRILKYGYPKVNDDGRALNLTEVSDRGVGVKENINAWIHLPWLQYYMASIPEFFAKNISDLYLKTGIVRTTFAFIGFLGVILAGFSFAGVFKKSKYLFLTFFLLLETLSVSLVLHLRELRSYSLTVFLLSLLFYFFVKSLNGKLKVLDRIIFFLLLFLLFNSYPPAYITSVIFLVLMRRKGKSLLTPMFVSIVTVIPLALFYETIQISSIVTREFGFSPLKYLGNIQLLFKFLAKYEFLYLFIFTEIVFLFFLHKKRNLLSNKRVFLSNSLGVFSVIYILVSARIPYFFERYFLFLLVLMPAILLINTFVIWGETRDKKIREVFLIFIFIASVLNSVLKIDQIRQRFYEMTHKYQGPMDFVIPYIKDKFPASGQLTIATNYEEPVYIYYLGAKVVVGYHQINQKEVEVVTPDIIIKRKGRPNNLSILNSMLQGANYKKVSFPFYDYQYNNIPELSLPLPHLFKTKLAKNENEKLEIYIKK